MVRRLVELLAQPRCGREGGLRAARWSRTWPRALAGTSETDAHQPLVRRERRTCLPADCNLSPALRDERNRLSAARETPELVLLLLGVLAALLAAPASTSDG